MLLLDPYCYATKPYAIHTNKMLKTCESENFIDILKTKQLSKYFAAVIFSVKKLLLLPTQFPYKHFSGYNNNHFNMDISFSVSC